MDCKEGSPPQNVVRRDDLPHAKSHYVREVDIAAIDGAVEEYASNALSTNLSRGPYSRMQYNTTDSTYRCTTMLRTKSSSATL